MKYFHVQIKYHSHSTKWVEKWEMMKNNSRKWMENESVKIEEILNEIIYFIIILLCNASLGCWAAQFYSKTCWIFIHQWIAAYCIWFGWASNLPSYHNSISLISNGNVENYVALASQFKCFFNRVHKLLWHLFSDHRIAQTNFQNLLKISDVDTLWS